MSHHLQGMIRVCNFQTLAHNTVDGNLKHSPTFIIKYENFLPNSGRLLGSPNFGVGLGAIKAECISDFISKVFWVQILTFLYLHCKFLATCSSDAQIYYCMGPRKILNRTWFLSPCLCALYYGKKQIKTKALCSLQLVIQQGQYLAIEFLLENIHSGILNDDMELLNSYERELSLLLALNG